MIEKFIDELKRQGMSENTILAYGRNARLFIEWIEATTGESFDNRISCFDGQEYRSYLLNIKKLKPTSVNAKLQAVQQFADFLASQGMQEQIKVKRQKIVASKNVKTIDKNTLYKCRRWAANYASTRDGAIFELLLNTGIRESELTALTASDIQIGERKGKLLVRDGKGNKSREIPLNSDARTAIQKYLAVRPAVSNERVFYGQRGPLQRRAIYQIIRKIGRKAAGVEDLTPHVLRHTCFSRMAKNGVDLTTIADLAGHSDVKLTAQYYIATSQEDKERALEGLYNT